VEIRTTERNSKELPPGEKKRMGHPDHSLIHFWERKEKKRGPRPNPSSSKKNKKKGEKKKRKVSSHLKIRIRREEGREGGKHSRSSVFDPLTLQRKGEENPPALRRKRRKSTSPSCHHDGKGEHRLLYQLRNELEGGKRRKKRGRKEGRDRHLTNLFQRRGGGGGGEGGGRGG